MYDHLRQRKRAIGNLMSLILFCLYFGWFLSIIISPKSHISEFEPFELYIKMLIKKATLFYEVDLSEESVSILEFVFNNFSGHTSIYTAVYGGYLSNTVLLD